MPAYGCMGVRFALAALATLALPLAGLMTPEISVVSGGLACIFATLAIAAFVPGLLKVKVR